MTGTYESGADQPAAGVQSVNRAFRLLETLASTGGRLSMSELAERSALPLGTVHRLLRTMVRSGYVRQDADRRYALGPALLPLGDAAKRLLGGWAQSSLVELAEETGESANIAVLDDDWVVYVAQAPGRHRMRLFTEVGRRVLPHSTAVGKVLLAWQTDANIGRIVRRFGLPPRTPNTVTSPLAFSRALAAVRSRGWAIDDQEEEIGVRCFAVPVGPGANAVAAISVSAPAARLQRDSPDVLAAMLRVAHGLAKSGSAPTIP